MIYYLPSCKVKANMSEASRKMQDYLSSHGVQVLGCCRVSQDIFKDGDTVITNCTSCAVITDENCGGADELSLYEYLLLDRDFAWPDYHGEEITVQDCYRAVHKPEVQKAVRECLKRMNIIPVELEENFKKTRFDGAFHYTEISAANLKAAPKYFTEMQNEYIEVKTADEIREIMKEHVKQISTSRVTCYCNSCRAGLKAGGADTVHMIELLTGNL